MAIKDLLVAYDGNEAAKHAAQMAVQMAIKYDASITGIHIYQSETYESHIRRWIPQDVLERMGEAQRDAEKNIGQHFREDLAAAGFKGKVDWVAERGRVNVLLPRYSRYFDLLLIGQFTSTFENELKSVQPEELVTRAGKPLIIVPKGHEVRPFTGRAAVAWDGSRSASRALTDAMQILETKEQLDVLVVDTDGGEPTGMPEGFDVVTHLKRHGIDARKVPLAARKDHVADVILAHCEKEQPDILVMGAYGRGKFGGMLFGGVTRHLLQNMNVPVMLSH